MKNIQVIDGAINAAYTIYATTDEHYEIMFPGGMDIDFIDGLYDRIGDAAADETVGSLWNRPVDRVSAEGIHGTLVYELFEKRSYFPSGRSSELSLNDSLSHRWLKTATAPTATAEREACLHVQVFDERPESDYPVFAVTRSEYDLLFRQGLDIEFEHDVLARLGWLPGHELLHRVFGRRVPKSVTKGFHGSFFRGHDTRRLEARRAPVG